MNLESGRRAKDDERLAMLAALVSGDVPLAYRLAIELLAQGVPFDDIAVASQTQAQRRTTPLRHRHTKRMTS